MLFSLALPTEYCQLLVANVVANSFFCTAVTLVATSGYFVLAEDNAELYFVQAEDKQCILCQSIVLGHFMRCPVSETGQKEKERRKF